MGKCEELKTQRFFDKIVLNWVDSYFQRIYQIWHWPYPEIMCAKIFLLYSSFIYIAIICLLEFMNYHPKKVIKLYVRDGSKFIGYPGRDHRQGGEDFFSKKKGGADFFWKKIRGAETFFRKKLRGSEDRQSEKVKIILVWDSHCRQFFSLFRTAFNFIYEDIFDWGNANFAPRRLTFLD